MEKLLSSTWSNNSTTSSPTQNNQSSDRKRRIDNRILTLTETSAKRVKSDGNNIYKRNYTHTRKYKSPLKIVQDHGNHLVVKRNDTHVFVDMKPKVVLRRLHIDIIRKYTQTNNNEVSTHMSKCYTGQQSPIKIDGSTQTDDKSAIPSTETRDVSSSTTKLKVAINIGTQTENIEDDVERKQFSKVFRETQSNNIEIHDKTDFSQRTEGNPSYDFSCQVKLSDLTANNALEEIIKNLMRNVNASEETIKNLRRIISVSEQTIKEHTKTISILESRLSETKLMERRGKSITDTDKSNTIPVERALASPENLTTVLPTSITLKSSTRVTEVSISHSGASRLPQLLSLPVPVLKKFSATEQTAHFTNTFTPKNLTRLEEDPAQAPKPDSSTSTPSPELPTILSPIGSDIMPEISLLTNSTPPKASRTVIPALSTNAVTAKNLTRLEEDPQQRPKPDTSTSTPSPELPTILSPIRSEIMPDISLLLNSTPPKASKTVIPHQQLPRQPRKKTTPLLAPRPSTYVKLFPSQTMESCNGNTGTADHVPQSKPQSNSAFQHQAHYFNQYLSSRQSPINTTNPMNLSLKQQQQFQYPSQSSLQSLMQSPMQQYQTQSSSSHLLQSQLAQTQPLQIPPYHMLQSQMHRSQQSNPVQSIMNHQPSQSQSPVLQTSQIQLSHTQASSAQSFAIQSSQIPPPWQQIRYQNQLNGTSSNEQQMRYQNQPNGTFSNVRQTNNFNPQIQPHFVSPQQINLSPKPSIHQEQIQRDPRLSSHQMVSCRNQLGQNDSTTNFMHQQGQPQHQQGQSQHQQHQRSYYSPQPNPQQQNPLQQLPIQYAGPTYVSQQYAAHQSSSRQTQQQQLSQNHLGRLQERSKTTYMPKITQDQSMFQYYLRNKESPQKQEAQKKEEELKKQQALQQRDVLMKKELKKKQQALQQRDMYMTIESVRKHALKQLQQKPADKQQAIQKQQYQAFQSDKVLTKEPTVQNQDTQEVLRIQQQTSENYLSRLQQRSKTTVITKEQIAQKHTLRHELFADQNRSRLQDQEGIMKRKSDPESEAFQNEQVLKKKYAVQQFEAAKMDKNLKRQQAVQKGQQKQESLKRQQAIQQRDAFKKKEEELKKQDALKHQTHQKQNTLQEVQHLQQAPQIFSSWLQQRSQTTRADKSFTQEKWQNNHPSLGASEKRKAINREESLHHGVKKGNVFHMSNTNRAECVTLPYSCFFCIICRKEASIICETCHNVSSCSENCYQNMKFTHEKSCRAPNMIHVSKIQINIDMPQKTENVNDN